MSKSQKKVDATQQTLLNSLFATTEKADNAALKPGDLAIAPEIRAALTRSIKQCRQSRWHIAARMSELLDTEISKYILDTWTAESKEGHRFPLEYLPAFIEATNDSTLLEILCSYSGGYFVQSTDHLRLELGRLQDAERRLKDRRKLVEKQLRDSQ